MANISGALPQSQVEEEKQQTLWNLYEFTRDLERTCENEKTRESHFKYTSIIT